MPDLGAARARVSRLVSGTFRTSDLNWLFIWLRERSNGMPSIIEIGHSLAHPDERDRGVVTESVTTFFRNIVMQVEFLDSEQVKEGILPSTSILLARKNFDSFDSTFIKEKTSFSRAKARSVLEDSLKKLTLNSEGSYTVGSTLSTEEADVLSLCLFSFVVQPFLTPDRLWDDFCLALRKNDVLQIGERKQLQHIKDCVVLFAAATFHRVRIKLDDDYFGWLVAELAMDKIIVRAVVPSRLKTEVFICFSFMETGLDVHRYCESALAEISGPDWRTQIIELTDQRKLGSVA